MASSHPLVAKNSHFSADRLSRVAKLLLDWYEKHKRDLPWRRARDPYAVWISEIMLQQTQVATVIPYYERWMQRFPDVRALARAEEDDVLHAFQGLGYYSRARSLLRAAREVETRFAGRIPDSVEDLRTLPGIGPYSAGAIASIAYGKPAPIVDGNVVRVLSRLFVLRGDPARAPLKHRLWELAREMIPEERASDFNQALMELGATVCSPQKPRCEACPWKKECGALREDAIAELPELAKRPQATEVRMAAAVVYRQGRVLVTQLQADAKRWRGMWQFPNTELVRGETPEQAAVRALVASTGLNGTPEALTAVVRHSVTRYRITLDAFRCRAANGTARAVGCQAVVWKHPDELTELAMPAAHRRIANRLASA